MKLSTKRLQQALLLCIGVAFFAPSLWFHLRMLDGSSSCHQQQQQPQQLQQHSPSVASSLASSSSSSREALELEEEDEAARDDRDVSGDATTDIGSITTEDTASSSSRLYNSICGSSLFSTRSAFSLWMEHLPQIFVNSRLKQDQHFQLHDLTLQVLQLYTPRLPLSVRTVTRNPNHLQALFKTTKARFDYLVEQRHERRGSEGGGATKKSKSNSSSSSPPPPPPVKIVVVGGSVTAGVNCISGIGNANLGLCAWPVRLETLINGMVHDMIVMSSPFSSTKQQLPPLVQVHVFAIGGSNTQTATTLLEYDLLPTLAKNPNVIINAYSTNDMHVDTVKVANAQQTTLSDFLFVMMQKFVRVVLRPPLSTRATICRPKQQQPSPQQSSQQDASSSSPPPQPPVLLWLDDYLGNEQRIIVETTAVSRAMHLLANFYGFASISYADAVRDLVYGDTHEQLFSPHWYKGVIGGNKKKKKNNVNNTGGGGGGGGDNFSREIHPGQGMHMATAWTVAYNMLHLATHHCSQQPQSVIPLWTTAAASESHRGGGGEGEDVFAPWPGLPQLRREKQIGGSIAKIQPGPTPDTLPPPLTDALNLRRVSADWQESHQAYLQQAVSENNSTSRAAHYCSHGDNDDYKQCPFSWIVGLPVNGRNVNLFHERESNAQDDMKEIHDYFVQHATRFDLGGWQVQDDSNRKKYGWVPPSPAVPADPKKSTMELEFWNFTQPIRAVTLFTMRSYGDKWADSTVKVVVSTAMAAANAEKVNWTTAVEKEMIGFHDKHTSEMYTEPIQLRNPIQPGDGLKIAISLIRGTTFKIQGMAVCS